MIRFLLILLSIIFLGACSNETKTENDTVVIEAVDSKEDETNVEGNKTVKDEPNLAASPRLSGKYQIKTYLTDSLGWGYTILEGTKVVVNQPHIPAIQGLKGFSSEARAMRAGEEVAFKLEQGIVPPTLTIGELKAIKVID